MEVEFRYWQPSGARKGLERSRSLCAVEKGYIYSDQHRILINPVMTILALSIFLLNVIAVFLCTQHPWIDILCRAIFRERKDHASSSSRGTERKVEDVADGMRRAAGTGETWLDGECKVCYRVMHIIARKPI